EHAHGARRQGLQAEQDLQERRLAGPVRAEDRGERAAFDREIDAAPEHPLTEVDAASANAYHQVRGPGDCGGAGHLPYGPHDPAASWRAASRPWSWRTCQAWNVAPAGTSVSVIVATGMPTALASSIWRWMSGVAF